MTAPATYPAMLILSLTDPVEGGRQLLTRSPQMSTRWMLLLAAVLVSVVMLYTLPVLTGETELMPSPFAFALTQGVMNVIVIAAITLVGQGFGGKGRFADVLWLVGWLQILTAGLLLVQIVTLLFLPVLNIPVGVASVAATIWILVGYICAVHGFSSRITVLMGGMMTFVILSFVLSMILLLFGFAPPEVSNV